MNKRRKWLAGGMYKPDDAGIWTDAFSGEILHGTRIFVTKRFKAPPLEPCGEGRGSHANKHIQTEHGRESNTTHLNRIRDSYRYQKRLHDIKDVIQVDAIYRLFIQIPDGVADRTFHTESRVVTCLGKYEHWALFGYISPYSGNPCRRGLRYEDIKFDGMPVDLSGIL